MDKVQSLLNIKLMLGIDDVSKDSLLNLYINKAEVFIKNFCNDDFMFDIDGDGVVDTYIFPVELESTLEDLVVIWYNQRMGEGIESERLGDRSITYNLDLPINIKTQLYKYRKMGFV